MFARRLRCDVDGIALWATTPEDLVIAKLNWARDSRSEVQLRDVANLIATGNLDMGYVMEWIGKLDLGDVWRGASK